MAFMPPDSVLTFSGQSPMPFVTESVQQPVALVLHSDVPMPLQTSLAGMNCQVQFEPETDTPSLSRKEGRSC